MDYQENWIKLGAWKFIPIINNACNSLEDGDMDRDSLINNIFRLIADSSYQNGLDAGRGQGNRVQ